MNSKSKGEIRKALGGGRWFPGDGKSLARMVDGFIEQAGPAPVEGRILAAIAPHAGYVYSGPVAGFAFRALRDQARVLGSPDTVVILGFGHRVGFQGVAIMDGTAIETPLGLTPLDEEAGAFLAAQTPLIFPDCTPHGGEHSAENQIPFAQRALPGARLVVGLIGDHEVGTMDALANALTALAQKKKIVVVASSDMLHDPDYDLVTKTDQATLQKVAGMDSAALLQDWGYERQTFCGIAPVITAMKFAAAGGCRKGIVLHYRNSGDDYPESRGEWVVGYGAAVFAA